MSRKDYLLSLDLQLLIRGRVPVARKELLKRRIPRKEFLKSLFNRKKREKKKKKTKHK